MTFRSVFFIILALLNTIIIINPAFSQDKKHQPKKVILMIGDGMGIPQIYAAYSAVADNLNIVKIPNTALVKTNSADDEVTDSAAAGTAIATGTKTNNAFIGVSPDNKPLKSILKIAEENGLATGMVTTSDITHATPASFIACVENRNQADLIAAQFLDTDIDVFIGGGFDSFAKRTDNRNYIDSLKAKNYQIALSLDELDKYNSGKVAGLLYPKHPPKMLDGRGEMLATATKKALEILSLDKDGFFLMIEGSQIDWGGHDNKYDYMLSELLDFDKAVGIVLDYAKKHPETLVIVTADHETGGLTLIESETSETKMQPNFSTGHHTGAPVALFAAGNGAEKFEGFLDNTDIFRLILSSYNFDKPTKRKK